MSALSEEVEHRLATMMEQVSEGMNEVTPETADQTIGSGYNSHTYVLKQRLVLGARKVYRRNAGATMPLTGQEYYDRVREDMVNVMISPVMASLADAILIGQENLECVRVGKKVDNYPSIFTDETFKNTSRESFEGMMTDDDLCGLIARQIGHSADGLARSTGYLESVQGDETIKKIWDLWLMSTTSVGIIAYKLGYEIGVNRREQEILAGIVDASEEVE